MSEMATADSEPTTLRRMNLVDAMIFIIALAWGSRSPDVPMESGAEPDRPPGPSPGWLGNDLHSRPFCFHPSSLLID